MRILKLLIIFYTLASVAYANGTSTKYETFSYGQGQSVLDKAQSSSTNKEPEGELTRLRDQLNQYVHALASVLLDKETSKENHREVLEELKTISEINGIITETLIKYSQSVENKGTKANTDDIKDENLSLWIKTQAELIKRKHLKLLELHKRHKSLDEEFYINLAFDGIVILAGSVLFLIPALGPSVSIPLIAGRVIAITGRSLGATLIGTGVADSGTDLWFYFFDEEEQQVLSFIPELVFGAIVIKEIFEIQSLAKSSDKLLAFSLFNSHNTEALIGYFLEAIQKKQYSAEAKRASLRALKAISIDMGEVTKKKVIAALKEVIESSQISSLREISASVLGEIGEGEIEVLEYLRNKGKDRKESYKFRLIALIQSGRNETTFPLAIDSLVGHWIKDKKQIKSLDTDLEIPKFFRENLLSAKKEDLKEEELKKYVSVLREFIQLELLDVELKLRCSETLMRLEGNSSNKEFLAKFYSKTKLVTELSLYVDNLSDETLSEANAKSFKFLKTELSKLKNIRLILESIIKKTINKFKYKYPDQDEIAKKISEFYSNSKTKLVTDLSLYVDKLFDETLFEANVQAFEFLKTELSYIQKVENIPTVEGIIKEVKLYLPKQNKIIISLEEFLDSYKKILETIQK